MLASLTVDRFPPAASHRSSRGTDTNFTTSTCHATVRPRLAKSSSRASGGSFTCPRTTPVGSCSNSWFCSRELPPKKTSMDSSRRKPILGPVSNVKYAGIPRTQSETNTKTALCMYCAGLKPVRCKMGLFSGEPSTQAVADARKTVPAGKRVTTLMLDGSVGSAVRDSDPSEGPRLRSARGHPRKSVRPSPSVSFGMRWFSIQSRSAVSTSSPALCVDGAVLSKGAYSRAHCAMPSPGTSARAPGQCCPIVIPPALDAAVLSSRACCVH
mmetsp:Transcript_43201/g.78587  ORF Transcript_43201/g.78587 Transcript_43201/m.78587 type:complete len:269 (-) Transcript_43201:922-1728(-)